MYSIYSSSRAGFRHVLVVGGFSTRHEAEVHIREQLDPGYYVISEFLDGERQVPFSEDAQYHLDKDLSLLVFEGLAGFRHIE